jgi:hypothetical protein
MFRSRFICRPLLKGGAAAALLWGFVGAAAGQTAFYYQSGDDLTRDCRKYLAARRDGGTFKPSDGLSVGSCYSYIVGILDMSSLEKVGIGGLGSRRICIQDVGNAHNIAESVAMWADEHPEGRSGPAYQLVVNALAERFPCP